MSVLLSCVYDNVHASDLRDSLAARAQPEDSPAAPGFVLHLRYTPDEQVGMRLTGNEAGQLHPPTHHAWLPGWGIALPGSFDPDHDETWADNETAQTRHAFGPAFVYQWSSALSLGLGLRYQKIRLQANFPGGETHGSSALGWDAGLLWRVSPMTRLGFSYHSSMYGPVGGIAASRRETFSGIDTRGHFRTPGIFLLSAWQRLTPKWKAIGGFSYSFRKSADGHAYYTWQPAWGMKHAYDSIWESKTGLASYQYGQETSPYHAQRLPDQRHFALSLGAQYRVGRASSLGFGYTHQWLKQIRAANTEDNARLRVRHESSIRSPGIHIQYLQDF
jgi:long-chain fatty acid transport protein